MNTEEQVAALERAIFDRATALAEEHGAQTKRAAERIQRDSLERLRLMEERENLSARARAEREYRRRIQASEIRMQAELDRLRWGLVEAVMNHLQSRLEALRDDKQTYLPVLKALLAEAANAIERDELEVRVSDLDHRRLGADWDVIAKEAAPDKGMKLSEEVCPCTGGVLVSSLDARISVDNTFEGLIEREGDQLHRVVMERLFPSATQMGTLFNG